MNELLVDLIAAARKRGLMGVGVVRLYEGGKISAGCLNPQGEVSHPCSKTTHTSAEAALNDLAEVMGVPVMRPEPPPVPACDVCQREIDPGTGQTTADTQLCEVCAQKARMRDPAYTPTIDESLADPESFVIGMTETTFSNSLTPEECAEIDAEQAADYQEEAMRHADEQRRRELGGEG